MSHPVPTKEPCTGSPWCDDTKCVCEEYDNLRTDLEDARQAALHAQIDALEANAWFDKCVDHVVELEKQIHG